MSTGNCQALKTIATAAASYCLQTCDPLYTPFCLFSP